MNKITDFNAKKTEKPVKILQFGEGNFLRAFADYMTDILNEKTNFNGSVIIVKPIKYGSLEHFTEQNCLYTVLLRGTENGVKRTETRLITCVNNAVSCYEDYAEYSKLASLDSLRFIVSNTTEAGIVYNSGDKISDCPPESFPGKLTKLLYERYTYFSGDINKGLIILPVELIDDNGAELQRIVKRLSSEWGLEKDFMDWLDSACVFASTLVDRIVTGYPQGEDSEIFTELGYEDKLLVTGELFALWVIESDTNISKELPFEEANLPVIFTNDLKPYKQRKVRILNGAHTSMTPVSFLSGNDYVGQSVNDEIIGKFINEIIYEEIIPTLDLPENELIAFAGSVRDRFKNPYINHALLSISLNGISKYRARCLPSLLAYKERKNSVPCRLAFSLAALAAFYNGSEIRDNALVCHRNEEEYEIRDEISALEFFAKNNQLPADVFIKSFLANTDFWGTELLDFYGEVLEYYTEIKTQGMKKALEKLI